jgi:hypothetical protein
MCNPFFLRVLNTAAPHDYSLLGMIGFGSEKTLRGK